MFWWVSACGLGGHGLLPIIYRRTVVTYLNSIGRVALAQQLVDVPLP